MASGVQPPTQAPSIDRYIPGEATPDAETHRKKKSFQECIEFLMPVYLLPFFLGDKEGACIYCVLLTVAGLMGRLLPPAVAAMIPVVVLPLGDVCGVDQLASQYFSPIVLSASLLFILAITGDETTIYFRLCLYVLEWFALRMQPLFVGMHLVVFALSLILRSNLVIIFSAVLIDRFVATVRDEIVGADQRSGVRIQTGLNYFDRERRPRYVRKTSSGPFGRRFRSVSVSDSGTLASEASGSSSGVKLCKRRHSYPRFEVQVGRRDELKAQRGPRKTSFAGFGRSPGAEVHLPVRRIRSFSAEPKRPSSILKHNAPPPVPPPSRRTPPRTPPCPQTSPWASQTRAVKRTKDRRGTFTMEDPSIIDIQVASAQGTPVSVGTPISTLRTTWSSAVPSLSTLAAVTAPQPVSKTSQEASKLVLTTHIAPSASVPSQPTPAAATPPPSVSVMIPEDSYSAAVDSSPALSSSGMKGHPSATGSGASSVSAKGSSNAPSAASSRKSRSRTSSRRTRDREANTMTDICESHSENLKQPKTDSTDDVCHFDALVQQSNALGEGTKLQERRTSTPKQKRVPDTSTEAKIDTPPAPQSEQIREPSADAKREVSAEQELDQKPEVRGVLKKRHPSLQPSTGSRTGSARSWCPLSPFENEEWNLESRTTPRGFTGAEPQTSSLRVRALTMAARPAFIAGAAYTAVFGNIASFNTVPVRDAVLVTLDCRDENCPVNWWSWLSVSLPVALVCCIACCTSIYCSSLVSCDDEIDEQTHVDLSRSAWMRHRNMKRHTVREALAFYWLVGVPVASSAYSSQHPGWALEVPLLTITMLTLSVAPGSLWRRSWSHRVLNWRSLSSRMPWSIILMLGSVMALSRTVEDYRLVERVLAKLDDRFWAQRSSKSSQFILVSVAAVLSELLVGESVVRSMASTMVRVAVMTETPVSFYVVPVSLAASINVMLPVSLPLLVMREYTHANGAQMVAYGILIKCVAVTAIFISMNSIGLAVFQGEELQKSQGMSALHNATNTDSAGL